MKKEDIIKVLQEEVVIPSQVQKKADAAFETIRKDAGRVGQGGNVVPLYSHRDQPSAKRTRVSAKKRRKKLLLAVLAAVLAIGTINVAAAYFNRSKGLKAELHLSEEQQVQMEEDHLSTYVDKACTVQGITVTALQSITDNYYTHIAFRIEGYSLEEGMEPGFESVFVTVDGHDPFAETSPENSFQYTSGFYSGIVAGEDGRPTVMEGSTSRIDSNGELLESYRMEDGSMEFQVTLANFQQKGFFIGKPIHIELKNLGTVSKAEYHSGIEGTWSFDWVLEGSDRMRECEWNAPLGDSGASVVRAEISPISLRVEYDLPRQEKEEKAIDENGRETTTMLYVEPPRLTGVKMKDGTLYPYLYLGPGMQGYESETSQRYVTAFAIDRVIDADQVESLLFAKPSQQGQGNDVEDFFYIVPLP